MAAYTSLPSISQVPVGTYGASRRSLSTGGLQTSVTSIGSGPIVETRQFSPRGRAMSPGAMGRATSPGAMGPRVTSSQFNSFPIPTAQLGSGPIQTAQFASGSFTQTPYVEAYTAPYGSTTMTQGVTLGSGNLSPAEHYTAPYGSAALTPGVAYGSGNVSPATLPPSHMTYDHGMHPAVTHGSASVYHHAATYEKQPLPSGHALSPREHHHHVATPTTTTLKTATPPPPSNIKEQLIAEFIGTFLLVFTVGCNVLSDNKVWAGVSIASVLMVMIYAFGKISGGNFNPAVTLALFLAKKIGGKKGKEVNETVPFMAVQFAAGIIAGLCYYALFGYAFNLSPARGFHMSALLIELLYTFVLCFVVLNVAAIDRDNFYYGLAIGFVVVAGAYAGGAISGGCFNPAVAVGIDVVGGASYGIGWALIYIVFEFFGAALAAVLFFVVRPWESNKYVGGVVPIRARLVAEFLGTFVLVVTVGLNVMGSSRAPAYSIAAALMCMVYALGDVSGANFNPAVTLAIHCCNKVDRAPAKDTALYMLAQIVGGIVGGFVYISLYHFEASFPLGPQNGFGWAEVAIAEVLFTFVLCLVVLCVAVSPATKVPTMFGLAIGACITVGGYAVGSISGGAFNPAVAFGIASTQMWTYSTYYGGGLMRQLFHAVIYSLFQFLGAFLAAQVVHITHKSVYDTNGGLSQPVPMVSKVVAEFIGTFFLVFTVGCNILSQTPIWGGVSIASVLMVMIYALGAVSGGHFNPAVTITQGLMNTLNRTGMPWKECGIYMATQIVAGIAAGFAYYALFDQAFNLAPAYGFSTLSVLTCELLYTFMLCFVVLNVTIFKNSYSGLAIGFVIVAGAYGAGAVSGGCFNPAVAIGVDVIGGYNLGIGYSLLYVPAQIVGAVLATFLFSFIRRGAGSLQSSLVSEFIGTFFLVLTVGLNVLAGSPAGAFSIAASLMCMVYALGDVSGAHFNPAVTLAILVCERDYGKSKLKQYALYMVAQLAGGLFATFTYHFIYGFQSYLTLGPKGRFGLWDVVMAEFIFTFVLCLVVLCVAVKSPTKDSDSKAPTPIFGLAIGSCITVGGFAIGAISGGSLNPAVSWALASSHLFRGGISWALIFSVVQFAAAIAAAGVVMFTHRPALYYKA